MTTLWNWSHTSGSTPSKAPFTPADLPALIAAVQQVPFGRRLRPMGHRHSVNHCFAADGELQIDMSGFGANDAPVVDPVTRTVTAAAGVTLLRIRDALARHDLELAVSPEIGNATAGSVACAGTKDGSLRGRAPGIGQISSLVTQVKIVDGAGNPRTITGNQLEPFRSSHGLMGIVYEVTFQAVTREVLEIEYEWLELDPLPSIDRIFLRRDGRRADGVLAFLQPYDGGRLVVERRLRLGPTAPAPSRRDQLKRAIRDFIWEWGQNIALAEAEKIAGTARLAPLLSWVAASVPPRDVPQIPPALVASLRTVLDGLLDAVLTAAPDAPTHEDVPAILDRLMTRLVTLPLPSPPPWGLGAGGTGAAGDFLRTMVDRMPVALEVLGGYRAYRSQSMIDFASNRFPKVFDFTFWAFPQSDWDAIVRAYVAFCDEYLRATHYRPAIFTEVYFIDRDRHSWLSFSPDEPIFTLNMVDAPREIGGRWVWDPHWFEMNRRFNRWAVEKNGDVHVRRGRPILNQTKELQHTPAVLAEAFGTDWTRFVSAVHSDPRNQVFGSPYFDGLGL